MKKLRTTLWFDDQAEEAARFYTSVFEDGKINTVTTYGPDSPREAGLVMTVDFEINGQEFVALNGGPEFSFNPSISFVIDCESQAEVDYFWDKLGEGGEHGQCGWLTDKFGLSWQIVPVVLYELVSGEDAASQRAYQAMLQMEKLEIDQLRKAYENV